MPDDPAGRLAPEVVGAAPAGSSASIDALIAAYHRARRRWRVVQGVLFVAASGSLLCWPLTGATSLPPVAGVVVLLVLVLQWDGGTGALVRRLASTRDARVTGVLAREVRDGHDRNKADASAGLVTILNQLTPADRDLVDDAVMRALTGLLSWRLVVPANKPELQLAVLQALERMGDTRAVDAVRALERAADMSIGTGAPAERIGRGEGAEHPRTLRDAASACLAVLEDRAEAERKGDRLLRPAAAPPDGTLLRPASGAPGTPEEHLLRPVEGDKG